MSIMQMPDDYYKKQVYVAGTNTEDVVTGPVERWKAHKEGILHRGFTLILIHEGNCILQHRKHPAFDGLWDLTCSSHQRMIDGILESDEDAMCSALIREWNIGKEDIEGGFQHKGKVYYKAKDVHSMFIEHEFDYVYTAALKKFPSVNKNFAYGCDVVPFEKSVFQQALSRFSLAPWVETMVKQIGMCVF